MSKFITIYDADNTTDTEQRLWQFSAIYGNLYMTAYLVQRRESRRHKWRTSPRESWNTYDERYGIGHAKVPVPAWVPRKALDEFKNRVVTVLSRPGPGAKVLVEA